MGVPFKAKNGLDANSNKIVNVANPTTAQDAATKIYVDNAVGTGLPSQTGNNGKFLTTNGTTASWSLVPVGGISATGTPSSTTYLRGDGTWATVTSGSGDVVGPASSTDNAVTRFDSNTGKLIQNSTVTLDDNGNFGNVNSVVLDNTPATLPTGAGTMYWEDGEGTAEVILKGGNTTLKVGTQEYARVYNDSGSTITLGQVVYISGAQGNRIAVKLAQADVEANSFGTLGLVAETIANGAEGWVIVSGALYKLNTNGLTAGAVVYLSPTTAGAYTTTKPQAPDQLVVLGFIERVSSTVGSIYVKVDNGYELDELHDVRITSPISGNTLIYDATTSPTGVWKNASLTAGTGISVTNGAGSITIGNTGVTSVSGTSPIVSSGGATPAISIPAATSSVNGYLTSGDWTNFNTGYTDRLKWDGGATGLTASTGRTSLGATTLGANIFTITNPSAVTFPRFNADNTVSSLDATTFRTAIGAGTGNGSVTSVAAGTYLTGGTITTSGTLAVDATSNNTASKVVARDGSGNFSAGTITASLSGNATTATTATNASILTTTNQGKTGSTGLVTVSSTTAWSDYPIGFSGMFLSGQTATGAPSSNYGFFIKIANRDGGGGWGGIWSDYSGGDTYVGNTTVSSSYATWYKLLSSTNYSSYALPLSGGTISGNLTVTGISNASVQPRTGFSNWINHNISAYTDASLISRGNTEDSWIWLDQASAQWGIYHRQIDSDLANAGQPTLPANSVGYVGGNNLTAWDCFADGRRYGKGSIITGNLFSVSNSNGTADFGPQNGSWCHMMTDRGQFYFQKSTVVDGSVRIYSDENNKFEAGALQLRGTGPTVYLRDTDHNSAMIHCNSNIFYILRGGNDTTTWATTNGYWPLEINLTNNDATFGRHIYAPAGYIHAVHFNQTSANSENPTVDQVIVTNGDNYFRKASKAHFKAQTGMYSNGGSSNSNRIIIQSTQPSGTFTNGDIWIQF